jgi:predicted membrane-bound dolichyl-phosphate-mannose-protein mannosyltransferase
MVQRLHTLATRASSLPLVLLAVLSLASFGARIAWIDDPCHAPCRTARDHTLIFDETYYVNAARAIAGVRPPRGGHYATAPLGDDPNSEHPQLAKLVIAGSIELFGDGPFAWRFGSIVLGSLAILAMFSLARAAGASRWQALGASALMATDNLLLVHGRIGTLDIYVVTAMVWAAALYLRGRPFAAGVAVGIGACVKLVAPYMLLVFVLLELLRRPLSAGRGRRAARRLAVCVSAAAGVFAVLLEILDRIAPPYDPGARKLISGGPLGHLSHMLSFSARQTSPHGPTGIASYPWQWLGDYKPIVYLNVNPSEPSPGLEHVHPPVHFLGMISPPILALALAGLVLAGRGLWRSRGGTGGELPILALAWTAGTLLPFEALNLFWQRTSYLYYMVIVMPGLYAAAVHLFQRWRPGPRVLGAVAVLVIVAAVVMYPFTPLPA